VSVKIEIDCLPSEMDEHLRALGFMRLPFVGATERVESPLAKIAESMRSGTATFVPPSEDQSSEKRPEVARENPTPTSSVESASPSALTNGAGSAASPTATARKPGEPSPNKRRRTAAEVAEDEAYFKANPPATKTEAPLISTGEARVDPAVVAQDEADEAAESAANRDGKLTLDDVRHAFGVYARKVGMPAAIGSIRDILGSPLNDVPQTQEALAKAIESINTAMGAPGPATITQDFLSEPPVHGTKADVVEAAKAYARKYDGTDVLGPKSMPNTESDIPKIIKSMFDENIANIKDIPPSPENYGKIMAAINVAVRDNPFKRQVHA
jgi:hypothetical protein